MQVLKSKRITSIGFALLVFAGGCKTNTASRGHLQADPGFNQETGRIRVYACKLDPIPNIYLPEFTVRNIIALDQSSLRLLSPEDDNGSVKFVDIKTSIERENPNSSVKFRKRGSIHISESTFQSDGETLFRESAQSKMLKRTWARGLKQREAK